MCLKLRVMPLSQPVEREHLHSRKIHCQGFRRRDGLWDIEAYLEDTKTSAFTNEYRGGAINPGEPIHGLYLRLTLDLDFVIHDIEAASDFTPYAICPSATEAMKKLKGVKIRSGWMSEVRKLVGSKMGCTHLLELLGPAATTAYQTMHPTLMEKAEEENFQHRPKILDTCVALSTEGPVVKRHWPQFYTGKE